MKRITYQGVKGAYSYLAALAMYGEENHFCPARTFKEVFECVKHRIKQIWLFFRLKIV